MAQVATAAPSREDFARLIDESFSDGHLQEGSVVKGTVVGIEKDVAVIDVGLKTEGRVRSGSSPFHGARSIHGSSCYRRALARGLRQADR